MRPPAVADERLIEVDMTVDQAGNHQRSVQVDTFDPDGRVDGIGSNGSDATAGHRDRHGGTVGHARSVKNRVHDFSIWRRKPTAIADFQRLTQSR